MVAEEFFSGQGAGNEESTLLQDAYDEEEDEEALSLCDLPIYSDSISSAQWGDFSKEDGKNSSPLNNNNNNDDDDDDDFFEFFSEEFTTSTTRATADNIIFCGKLIPFKDHPHAPEKKQKNHESNIQKGGALLPRSPNSMDKARPTSKAATTSDASFKKGREAKGSTKSFTSEYSSIGKVSLMRSTTTRSRWFLFMFGMSRLSNTEMELRDIRSRQSRSRRSSSAAMFTAPEHGGEGKVKGRRNCKGVWRMLRSISVGLGCSSSRLAKDVVKAAFV